MDKLKITPKEIKAIFLILSLVCALIIGSWQALGVFCVAAALAAVDDINFNATLRSGIESLAKDQNTLRNTIEILSNRLDVAEKTAKDIQKIADETKTYYQQAQLAGAFPTFHPRKK